MTLSTYLLVFCLVPGSFLAVALLAFTLHLALRAGLAAARERINSGAFWPGNLFTRWA